MFTVRMLLSKVFNHNCERCYLETLFSGDKRGKSNRLLSMRLVLFVLLLKSCLKIRKLFFKNSNI